MLGAGAIGTYVGGLLARNGHDVSVIVRPGAAHPGTLEILQGPDAGNCGRVAVVDRLADASPADLVLVTVKTYDTDVAARQLVSSPALIKDTTVLELQNGVDRAQSIDAVLGRGLTLAGTIFLECRLEQPGQVRFLSGARRILLGEPDGAVSARATRVGALLQDAGFVVQDDRDVRPGLWRKFMLVCAANALTGMTRQAFGGIISDPLGRKVTAGIIAEVVAVGRAEGIDLPGDVVEESVAFLRKIGPQLRSSMLHDVLRGRSTEVDALNGTVVRLAQTHDIHVPRNELLTLALHRAGSQED